MQQNIDPPVDAPTQRLISHHPKVSSQMGKRGTARAGRALVQVLVCRVINDAALVTEGQGGVQTVWPVLELEPWGRWCRSQIWVPFWLTLWASVEAGTCSLGALSCEVLCNDDIDIHVLVVIWIIFQGGLGVKEKRRTGQLHLNPGVSSRDPL